MKHDILETLVKLGEETGMVALVANPSPTQIREHFVHLFQYIVVILAPLLGG
jgi:hypothetical protein